MKSVSISTEAVNRATAHPNYIPGKKGPGGGGGLSEFVELCVMFTTSSENEDKLESYRSVMELEKLEAEQAELLAKIKAKKAALKKKGKK